MFNFPLLTEKLNKLFNLGDKNIMNTPKRKKKVFLSDGHTLPIDPGVSCLFDKEKYPYTEAELIRKINQVVVDNFYNFFNIEEYELTHINNDGTEKKHRLLEKINLINETQPSFSTDIAIESHLNYHRDSNVQGWLDIIGKSNKLGDAFRRAQTIEELKTKGIYTTKEYYSDSRNKSKYRIKLLNRTLGFISRVNCPSIIVENCFMSSPHDMEWLYSDFEGNIEKLAYVILNGIKNYYGEGDN